MLPITQALLTNHNRPGKKLIKLKGIVIHWTANTNAGANAVANRNYFNTTAVSASAHYVVDDRSIIQCVPDNEVAYHVGASKYTAIGQDIKEGAYSPNYFLVGIEMCVNRDSNWSITYMNTVELAAYLLKKHNLQIDRLYRHYDITGKDCPRMMLEEAAWNEFRALVRKKMEGDKLSWKEIINKVADDPVRWERAINMLVMSIKMAKALGDTGDAGILEYIPTLIEKAHRG